jgi:tetratricopeptide (TPR) repeat protein
LSRGDYDRAVAAYTQAIRLNPNLSRLYGLRGMAYYYKGDFDSVIADCFDAILINQNNIDAYTLRAYAFFNKGEFYAARQDVNRVLQADPYNEDMRRFNAQLRQMGY